LLRRAIAAIISALAFPCGGAKEARFGARELRKIITDHTSKPVGVWAESQPSIPKGEQSGLLTRIVTTESVSLCAQMKS
jgi:hypothetical protein